MRAKRNLKIEPIPTFSFVVDGETEIWYLQMLKRNERHLKVNIEPKLPQRKSIVEQYSLVKSLSSQEYTKVFWIVDFDSIISESRVSGIGKRSSVQIFSELREDLIRNQKNVVVIINNPCLEFWFLLHFKKTSRFYENCVSVEAELKKYLVGYEKNKRFFTKEGNDIYLKLRPYLDMAILNSRSLGYYDFREYKNSISDMHLLFIEENILGS